MCNLACSDLIVTAVINPSAVLGKLSCATWHAQISLPLLLSILQLLGKLSCVTCTSLADKSLNQCNKNNLKPIISGNVVILSMHISMCFVLLHVFEFIIEWMGDICKSKTLCRLLNTSVTMPKFNLMRFIRHDTISTLQKSQYPPGNHHTNHF